MKKVLLVYEDFQESTKTQSFLKKIGFDVVGQQTTNRLGTQILNFNPDVIVSNGGSKFTSLEVAALLREQNAFKGKSVVILPTNQRPSPQDLVNSRIDVLLEAPVVAEKLVQVLAKLFNMDVQSLLGKFKKIQEGGISEKGNSTVAVGGTLEEEESIFVKSTNEQKEELRRFQKQKFEQNKEKILGVKSNNSESDVAGVIGHSISAEDGPQLTRVEKNDKLRSGIAHSNEKIAEIQGAALKSAGEPISQDQPARVDLNDKERVANYQKHLQGIKIDKKKTSHSKQAVKNSVKEMKKEWDNGLLEDLNKLKLEFAEALFKKK